MPWSKEYSLQNGTWFWLRDSPDETPRLVQITGGRNWLEAFGLACDTTEFLGPITPEQAEQFDALRKASEVALKWMDWWLDSELCECDGHGHICGKTERRREADALRRALGKEQ